MSRFYLNVIFITFSAYVSMASCFIVSSSQNPLKVASFNIKHFGRSKMSDNTIADWITQICSRYDVIFIMETRDSSHSAIDDLWTRLNKSDSWGLAESAPIGRSNYYKEQYIYFYRIEKAKLVSTFQVQDPNDVYEREPFCAEFQYWSESHHGTRQVAMLGLHAKPDDVKSEMEHLPATIRDVGTHFPASDGVVAMGDFNADCRYASTATLQQLEIFNSPGEFTSLIPASVDTAVSSNSDCAYDRLVLYGNLTATQARIYNFTSDMQLTFQQGWDISDHYPVEFQLH